MTTTPGDSIQLSPKQWRFVEAYRKQPPESKNPSEAAITAGYARSNASRTAKQLLSQEEVRFHILTESKEQVRQVVELSVVNKAWLLREVHNLWETPFSDLFNDDGSVRLITEIPPQAQKLIAGFTVETRRERTHEYDDEGREIWETVRTTKVQLVNRVVLLRMIGDHTTVDAFGGAAEADKNSSMAALMRTIANAAERGDAIELNPRNDPT